MSLLIYHSVCWHWLMFLGVNFILFWLKNNFHMSYHQLCACLFFLLFCINFFSLSDFALSFSVFYRFIHFFYFFCLSDWLTETNWIAHLLDSWCNLLIEQLVAGWQIEWLFDWSIDWLGNWLIDWVINWLID